jgi:hypothetical protein
MISPQNAAEMVLSYHTHDPQYAAALVLDAIDAAGYVVLNRKDYIEFLSHCANLALETNSRISDRIPVGVNA